MPGMQTNRACFTLNNFTTDEQTDIANWIDNTRNGVEYAIIGEECGEKGNTIHLQGFIRIRTDFLRARNGILKYWRSIPGLERAHWESARGSDHDSEEYCSKEGIYRVWGTPKEGGSNPYENCYKEARKNLQRACDEYPEFAIKHYGNLQAISNITDDVQLPELEVLRGWQVNLRERCIFYYCYERSSRPERSGCHLRENY